MPTLTPSSEDVRIYETCILYPNPLTQKEESALLKEIEATFAEAKATEISRDNWGRRGLAYTIEGYDQGNFIVLYHEMKPEALKELEANLKLVPNVLRYIIIKPPKGYEVEKYSEKYEEWKKDRAAEEEAKKKEKEERLKKRMLRKQKAGSKSAKNTSDDSEDIDKDQLSADIDSLLDNQDITL